MRIKKTIRAVAFCIILVLFLNHIYGVFAWKDTAGDYISSMETFYDMDEDLVDVLFLGSSRCYCTINQAVFWEEQGIAGFNFSISGQDLASSYHCMVEALKTQTPEVVCLELYGSTFHGYGVESNMYRNTLSYKYSLNAVDAVKSIAEDRMGELLLRWPIVHTRYKELKKGDFVKSDVAYLGYQAEFQTQSVPELLTYTGDEQVAIAAEEEEWIRKIIALGEENDIELCFFVSPAVYSDFDAKKLNYVEGIAAEHNIPVLNMPELKEDLRLDLNTDFIDWAHTNYFGAQKVSSFMANFLMQNFDLQDRRGQEGYELWEENAKARRHEFFAQQLKVTGDMEGYLNLLATAEDCTIVVASTGEYLSPDTSFEEYEAILGLVGFYEGSGIWVVENGQVVLQSVGQDSWDYLALEDQDLVVTNTAGTADTAGITNIVVDKVSYNKVGNGVNLVVYDHVLNKVIDAVGFEATAQYSMIR